MDVGYAGEFCFVVTDSFGNQKLNTGYQKNLLLNTGLEFFGGNYGQNLMEYCVLGSGNSTPVITQNKLDVAVAAVSGTQNNYKYDYVDDGSNLYKCWLEYKYVFNNLAGMNIAELGLASQYSGLSNYYLCTRALIKDANGNNTVMSFVEGDTLTVYYRIWAVHSTLDVDKQIYIDDGFGNNTLYNTKHRLIGVASRLEVATALSLKAGLPSDTSNTIYISDSELRPITGYIDPVNRTNPIYRPYIANSYERIVDFKLTTSQVGLVRTVSFSQGDIDSNCFVGRQIRYGRASDDAAIDKNNTNELTLAFKFKWGRYEGTL